MEWDDKVEIDLGERSCEDGGGSGPCCTAGCGISGVEHSGVVTSIY
jgi:hypothetical protein